MRFPCSSRRDVTRVSVDFRVIPKQYYQTVYKDCLRLDGQPRFSVGAYYQETGPLPAAAAAAGTAAAAAASRAPVAAPGGTGFARETVEGNRTAREAAAPDIVIGAAGPGYWLPSPEDEEDEELNNSTKRC